MNAKKSFYIVTIPVVFAVCFAKEFLTALQNYNLRVPESLARALGSSLTDTALVAVIGMIVFATIYFIKRKKQKQ